MCLFHYQLYTYNWSLLVHRQNWFTLVVNAFLIDMIWFLTNSSPLACSPLECESFCADSDLRGDCLKTFWHRDADKSMCCRSFAGRHLYFCTVKTQLFYYFSLLPTSFGPNGEPIFNTVNTVKQLWTMPLAQCILFSHKMKSIYNLHTSWPSTKLVILLIYKCLHTGCQNLKS